MNVSCVVAEKGTEGGVTKRKMPAGHTTGGHGIKGMSLLFVDGHSQFALYQQLSNTFGSGTQKIYNLDWTAGGLSGADLTR